MSSQEKNTWIFATATVFTSAVYFALVLGQLGDKPVGEIRYERLMIIAIVVAVALNILGNIIAAIAAPKDADKTDERDVAIGRYGEYIGYYVLSIAMIGALALAMLEYPQFWIANAIYLAFVISALTASAVKIVVYRRGF